MVASTRSGSHWRLAAILLAAVLSIAACSDSSDEPAAIPQEPPVQPPQEPTSAQAHIVDLERDVLSGHRVTLHGFSGETQGEVQYQWQQISGPDVTLENADTATPSFVAPAVDTPAGEPLGFELVVTDELGSSEPVEATVLVHPKTRLVVHTRAKRRQVVAGDTVTLHATGGGTDSPTWEWGQLQPAPRTVDIQDANTPNPQFIAPDLDNVTLRFQVRYSDSDGHSANSISEVLVVRPVEVASTVPLTVIGASTSTAQVLRIAAPADAIVITGRSTNMTMAVVGGEQPYQWLWEQIDGPTAVLNGISDPIVHVQSPGGLSQPEVMSFRATVIDNAGTERTGIARVVVYPEPSQDPEPIPQIQVIRTPPLVVTPMQTTTITTTIPDPVVTQTGGSQLASVTTTNTPGGTGSTVSIAASLIGASTETAQVTVQGTNNQGQTTVMQVPVLVMQTPNQVPPTVPPVVVPPLAPHAIPGLLEALKVVSCGADAVDEGQHGVILGACASGGDGQYTYQWTYLPGTNSPAINLRDAQTSHPQFDAPGVDANTIIRFQVEVTSALQTVTEDVVVQINDVAASLVVDALQDIHVINGQFVSLHQPVARGGVPPYSYSVTQTVGTPVGVLSGNNPAFPVPSLNPGDPDEILEFEYTVTDGYGNTLKTPQKVVVEAPPPTLAVSLDGPSNVNSGDDFTLHVHVTGGTPPFFYAWAVHPQDANGQPLLSIPRDDANPTVTAPTLNPGDQPLNIRVGAIARDSGTPVQHAFTGPVDIPGQGFEITVNPPPQPAQPAQPPGAALAAPANEAAKQSLAGALAQAGTTAADLSAAIAQSAAGLPDSVLTAAISGSGADAAQAAGCGVAPPSGACIDRFIGDCVNEFPGMCTNCFVVNYCAKSCDICAGVTPEMKAQIDAAYQELMDWLNAHPGCTYLQPGC